VLHGLRRRKHTRVAGSVLLHDETQNFRLGRFARSAARGFNGFREITPAPIDFERF
jgi:hypothetical protein